MTKDSDRTSSQQDFLANLSVSQEKENLRKMTEISGRKLLGLSKSPDQLGLLEKTLMESLNSISTPYLRTWKIQTTPQGALIFQLRASVLPTKDKGYGLLPTPRVSGQENPKSLIKRKGIRKAMQHNLTAAVQMYPTPGARDSNPPEPQEKWEARAKKKKEEGINLHFSLRQAVMYPTPRSCDLEGGVVKNVEMNKGSFSRKNKKGVRWGVKLKDAVHHLEKQKLYPTPKVSDMQTPHMKKNEKGIPHDIAKGNLRGVVLASETKTGGRLNPNFVEYLMGFQQDWTRIDQTGSKDSETQSCRKSHSTSDKP